MNTACDCLSRDAAKAHAAIFSPLREQSLIVDDSHYIVDVIRCPVCGQLFPSIFTELIDWEDGDDSQARTILPITLEECCQIAAAGENADDRFIRKMKFNRPTLWWIMPKGCTEGHFSWREGPLMLFRMTNLHQSVQIPATI